MSQLVNPIDPRIQNLSYSSRNDLHSCPRKYQLIKLNSKATGTNDIYDNLTFAFGHLVGDGIARSFIPEHTLEQIYWQAFLDWPIDLNIENERQMKSFWRGMIGVEKFIGAKQNGFLEDYELVYYKNKEGNLVPAIELSFIIHFPDGFKYRGFVDVVVRHKVTGKIVVLECKTSSANEEHASTYRNSAQAIGYSIVLDNIFPDITSYEVKYLVYYTKKQEWATLQFEKSYTQRALWIQELLLDIETIKMYEQAGIYPMHGESCFSFYKDCKYLGICTMSTSLITNEMTKKEKEELEEKNEQFQIRLEFKDLLANQLNKV